MRDGLERDRDRWLSVEGGRWVLDERYAKALGNAVLALDQRHAQAQVVTVLHRPTQDHLLGGVVHPVHGGRDHVADEVERVL